MDMHYGGPRFIRQHEPTGQASSGLYRRLDGKSFSRVLSSATSTARPDTKFVRHGRCRPLSAITVISLASNATPYTFDS